MRGRGSFPGLMNSGPALLLTSAVRGRREGHISLPPRPPCSRWRGKPDLLCSHSEGGTPAASINVVSSTTLPRWGTGPSFLNVAADKGEGQFLSQLEAIESEGGSYRILRATIADSSAMDVLLSKHPNISYPAPPHLTSIVAHLNCPLILSPASSSTWFLPKTQITNPRYLLQVSCSALVPKCPERLRERKDINSKHNERWHQSKNDYNPGFMLHAIWALVHLNLTAVWIKYGISFFYHR